MSDLFFTSDLHLGHANSIRFTDRPYSCVDEMNEALIKNINGVVGKNDELYILGDVSFRTNKTTVIELLKEITCRNLHLVVGNHDLDFLQDEVFKTVEIYQEIRYADHELPLVLFHYPISDWNRKRHGAMHLHGHIHSVGPSYNEKNFAIGNYAFDVGVDANSFKPVSIEEIIALKNKTKENSEPNPEKEKEEN